MELIKYKDLFDQNKNIEFSKVNFDKINDLASENTKRLNIYATIITCVWFACQFISYLFFWDYVLVRILIQCIPAIICVFSFIVFFLLILDISGNNNNTRIPTIIGNSILALIALYLATCTQFFSEGMSAEKILTSTFVAFIIWLYVSSVYIFAHVFMERKFPYPQIIYTARITGKSKSLQSKGRYNYHVQFVDDTNCDRSESITKEEYENWKVNEPIQVVLSVRDVENHSVEKITRLDDFLGQTDMEICQEIHKRDVELFGQSQYEMDIDSGKNNKLGINLALIIICLIDLTIYFIMKFDTIKHFNKVMMNNDIYSITLIASISLTILMLGIGFISKKKIDTVNSIGKWIDLFVPTSLLYFSSIFALIGGVIGLYMSF